MCFCPSRALQLPIGSPAMVNWSGADHSLQSLDHWTAQLTVAYSNCNMMANLGTCRFESTILVNWIFDTKNPWFNTKAIWRGWMKLVTRTQNGRCQWVPANIWYTTNPIGFRSIHEVLTCEAFCWKRAALISPFGTTFLHARRHVETPASCTDPGSVWPQVVTKVFFFFFGGVMWYKT